MNPSYFLPPLHAMQVVVSPMLVGSKHALQFGNGPVYVSPAMHVLMKDATPDELKLLLEKILILRLPPMPDFSALPPTLCGEPSSCNYAAAMLDARAFIKPSIKPTE